MKIIIMNAIGFLVGVFFAFIIGNIEVSGGTPQWSKASVLILLFFTIIHILTLASLAIYRFFFTKERKNIKWLFCSLLINITISVIVFFSTASWMLLNELLKIGAI